MKIMSLNSGSSSVKIQLFEMPSETVIAKFSFEKIGFIGSFGTIKYNQQTFKVELEDNSSHDVCIKKAIEFCLEKNIIKNILEIKGVGHRVVMGADLFAKSELINQDVEEKIIELFELAPLHNPANYAGIKAFKSLMPGCAQVACFDTSFHANMPKENVYFPIKQKYANEYNIKRYGAHGTSCKFVVQEYAKICNKPLNEVNVIVAHIGSGASITSVKNGVSYDTSMGYSPLGGIAMGTRSGDLDPSCVIKMIEVHNGDYQKVLNILNKESGLLGVSGISNDMRDIQECYNSNESAKLAFDILCKRIIDFIGSYAIKFAKLDAVILTAGIGEQSQMLQQALKNDLQNIGVDVIKDDICDIRNGVKYFSTSSSKVDYLTIPTNEELMIARDTFELIK